MTKPATIIRNLCPQRPQWWQRQPGVLVLSLLTVILAGCALPLPLPQPGTGAQPVIAAQYTPATDNPLVYVSGAGWQPETTVFINLRSPQGDLEGTFAVAETNSEGQFTISFFYPTDARWRALTSAMVVARSSDGEQEATIALLTAPLPETPVTATAAITPTLTTTPTQMATPPSTPATPTRSAATGRSTATWVNVRVGPSTQYPVLTAIRQGTQFTVIGQNATGAWLRIRLENGVEGWISRALTDFTDSAPVVATPPLVIVTPPPPVTPTPVITEWQGEYFANANLAGAPALVRNDRDLSFDWGSSAPAIGLPADRFSVRWTRTLEFERGLYRFVARMDDGLRLFVDGNLVIDQWQTGSVRELAADYALSDGVHTLRVEYFENTGNAVAQLRWERVSEQPTFLDWRGEYFPNRNLQGNPVVVRNDPAIDFNWGAQAPATGLPGDNFSVRWTRTLNFDEGRYRFNARADDGIRVYVDGNRIIDEWHDNEGDEVYTVEIELDDDHQLTVEYYEGSGGALVEFWWQRVQPTPTATPAPPTDTPTATATQVPPTATPVPTNTPEPSPTATAMASPTPVDTAVVTATLPVTTADAAVNTPLVQPALSYRPPDAETCEAVRREVQDLPGVEVTRLERPAPFQSIVDGLSGQSCRISTSGTGEDFTSFVEVAADLVALLQRQGWQQDPAYTADGPTGTVAGLRRDDELAVVQVAWSPTPGVECPPDQPIATCAEQLEPAQMIYTITIELVASS